MQNCINFKDPFDIYLITITVLKRLLRFIDGFIELWLNVTLDTKKGHFGDVFLSQELRLVLKKLNLTLPN